jgi:DNA replication ATP-dependent helicase Dna2
VGVGDRQFDSNNKCVVDGDENLLILHPDILVTGTTVGESYFCMRKSILNNKAKVCTTPAPFCLVFPM